MRHYDFGTVNPEALSYEGKKAHLRSVIQNACFAALGYGVKPADVIAELQRADEQLPATITGLGR